MTCFQTIQGFACGHDRDAIDVSECQHMSLVAGDDQVGLCRDCRSQDRVVLGIRRQVHRLRLIEDDGPGVEVLDYGCGFLGVEQLLHSRPGENLGYLGDLRS